MKTFGDSTKTPGQHSDDRCYIVAQLPESSNLDWARDLRTVLGGDELKYKKYLSLRHSVQANKHLWKRVIEGTAEATIVVIESRFYIDAIAYRLHEQGADIGHDVGLDQILCQAALCMIDHAPIMRLPELMRDHYASPLNLPIYTPALVLKKIGSKLNDAAVFAARAHAAFDIDDLEAASTNEMFLSPFRMRLLANFNSFDRVFDEEHPKSVTVLNDIFDSYNPKFGAARSTRISETKSEGNDWLQAADFCAGFAAEIMMNATDDRERELRRHFRRVIYNGATK